MRNVRRLPSRRLLAATTALSTLALVATLSCGQEPREERPEDWDEFLDGTVIVKVGDETVTARDFDDQLRLNFPQLYDGYSIQTERSIRDVLKLQLEHYLISFEAERLGFPDTSRDFQQTLAAARRNILQQLFVTHVLNPEVEPSEEELRARYEDGKERYAVPRQSVIKHILVETRAEAEAALARVEGGEPFNDVVADLTLDEMNNITGSVGWVQAGKEIRGNGMLPNFTKNSLEMAVGENRIIETEKGWHVLHCTRIQEAGYRPFEEVRDALAETLRRQRQAMQLDLKMREYRARYGARVYDENLAAYLAWRREEPESELWAAAQAEEDPQTKIAGYENFIQRYPQSEHACEARFMIGFTYAEEMNDRNRARIALREFVRECPNSDLVESAEFMIGELSSATP